MTPRMGCYIRTMVKTNGMVECTCICVYLPCQDHWEAGQWCQWWSRMLPMVSQCHRAGPPTHRPVARSLVSFNPSASNCLMHWPRYSHNSSHAAPFRGPLLAKRLTATKVRPPALSLRSCHATWPISKLTAHPDVSLFSIQNSWPERQPFISGVPRPINVSMLCQWIFGRCF